MKQSALLDEALIAAAVLCGSFFRRKKVEMLTRRGTISVKKCGGH